MDVRRLQRELTTYTGEQTARDGVIKAMEGLQTNTLFSALATSLQNPELASLLDKPYHTLQAKEIELWSHKWAASFLHLELCYCQERLLPALLRPLYAWLQTLKIASLTLIPCGYLAMLPLTTFLLDDGETLGEKIPTSLAPSALSLTHASGSSTLRTGVHTFGNPQSDLYWGEREAHALAEIARQLHINNRKAVQGAVTRDALFQSLQNAQIVDLSCHGLVKSDDYLQSFLHLARKPLSAESPQLTLAEILHWEREVQGLRLLILSSCQSAVPDARKAVEEVRSLSSALLQAGARAVLAPLWSVNEKATYLLMVRFAQEWFPRMHAEPPAAALARAQCWLRTVTNHELAHWETSPCLSLLPKEQAGMTTDQEEAKSSPLSYEVTEVQKGIRKEAAHGDPSRRPYANPIYWAGFQIAGW
jgi:CHAT domain-containing protein